MRTSWMRLLACLSVCTFVLGGSSASAQPKKPARITFDDHVLPIMKDKCAGCHNQDKKRAGLVVVNYTALMAGGSSGASVKPGDPDGSLLYKVMAHTQEPFMPPKSPKLAADTLDTIHKWIAGGAPENSGSKVVMPDRPRVDFTLPAVAKGKPAGPPPMPPATLSLEPVVRAARDTAVTALASSPWAPLVAVGGQKQILLYNSDTQDLLGVLAFPEGTPHVLKFSRNGSLLLAGGGRGGKTGKVVIWSVPKAERLFTIGDESDAVLAADISPDQTQIALGGPSKLVRIYSTRDGKKLHEIKKHTDWITTLEFSPDGVLLASGDRSGGLYVWEAFTAREYFALRGHTAAITDVSWRPDSNAVASGSEDGTIRLFEMENGNQFRTWGAHGGVLSLAYGRDGRLVSTGRDRVTRLWDGNGGAQRAFEAFPDLGLRSIFSHDTGRVIAADWTGQVLVFNSADGKRVGALSANPPGVAEQLASAQQVLNEKQKQFDALSAVAKASDAAYAKVNADLAQAQKAVTDTAAAFKVAEQKLTQVRATVTTAQTALKGATDEAKAKQTLAQALTEAAVKVKAEADRQKDNPRLQDTATRAMAMSGQASAEQALADRVLVDISAAYRAVEPQMAPAQQAFNTTQAAMQAAPKAVPGLVNAQKAMQAKAAADKAAADRAAQELAQAKVSLARWQSLVARRK